LRGAFALPFSHQAPGTTPSGKAARIIFSHHRVARLGHPCIGLAQSPQHRYRILDMVAPCGVDRSGSMIVAALRIGAEPLPGKHARDPFDHAAF